MKRLTWLYVPTLYFAESLPYFMVNSVSIFMYKSMGVSNTVIGLTSYLYLPWVIKMFWGPAVDLYATKRGWIRSMQILMALAFGVLAVALFSPAYLTLSLIIFTVVAFLSATHDIATDGFYMLALSKDDQAFYVGIRSLFYRLGAIFTTSGIVIWAGRIETSTGNIPYAWSVAAWMAAGTLLALFVFHTFFLPRPPEDVKGLHAESEEGTYLNVFKTYFQQPGILPVVLFILLYRLGEAMLVKMLVPFLRDPREAGGLGIDTAQVGFIYGTVGIVSLVAGGLLGGWVISRFGLKKCIWPMAIALNLPDAGYVYLAKTAEPAMTAVYAAVGIEQFGYGLGFTAFMVFLMETSKGAYKTAHFAISTGLMALGMMVPGMISGKLQELLGYGDFFILVLALTLPGMLIIPFLPIEETNRKSE
ncbi:AmpG family muropeptide MFS transporter [bacterium]|nr:AmpG family muropeptide MFS transporter [bacterium]